MTGVTFDSDEQPEEFSVVLSLDEVALLYRLTGHISPQRITDASGAVKWGNALFDVAGCLGGMLNRFFDAGIEDVAPKFKNLYAPDPEKGT